MILQTIRPIYTIITQIWGKLEPYLIGFCGSLIPFKYRKCVFENIQHNICEKVKLFCVNACV